MKNLDDRIPAFGYKTRLDAMDLCVSFLYFCGALHEGEKERVRNRINKMVAKDKKEEGIMTDPPRGNA